AYFVGALAPDLSTGGRVGLATTPLVWIVVKELLRSRYYQRFGRVEEVRPVFDRRLHLGLTLFTALVSVGIVVTVLVRQWPLQWDVGTVGYLAYVAAMPLLVWLFMRTPLEFIVGVFLVAQAALVLAGGSYRLWEQPPAPSGGVALLVGGGSERREFWRLELELKGLRGGQGCATSVRAMSGSLRPMRKARRARSSTSTGSFTSRRGSPSSPCWP